MFFYPNEVGTEPLTTSCGHPRQKQHFLHCHQLQLCKKHTSVWMTHTSQRELILL